VHPTDSPASFWARNAATTNRLVLADGAVCSCGGNPPLIGCPRVRSVPLTASRCPVGDGLLQ
jgi:hypothetical protein